MNSASRCVDGHEYNPAEFRCYHSSHFCRRESCGHDEIVHGESGCYACYVVYGKTCSALLTDGTASRD